jgi:hypothetical protein
MPGVLACCCDPPEPQGECGSICRSACCFYSEAKIGGWSFDFFDCHYGDSGCENLTPIPNDDPSTYKNSRVLVNDGLMVSGPDMTKWAGANSTTTHCATWVSDTTYKVEQYLQTTNQADTCPSSTLISSKMLTLFVSWSRSGYWEWGRHTSADPNSADWNSYLPGTFDNSFYESDSRITSCCGGAGALRTNSVSACSQEDSATWHRGYIRCQFGAVSNNYCCRCAGTSSCVDTSPASEAQCQDGTGGDSDANFCGDGTGGSRDNNNECPP